MSITIFQGDVNAPGLDTAMKLSHCDITKFVTVYYRQFPKINFLNLRKFPKKNNQFIRDHLFQTFFVP